jgi:anti-anti-sigma factor
MVVLNKRQEIDELVANHQITRLLLDFVQVNLTGSAALGMLIRLKAGLAQRGCRLGLCRIQAPVAQVLRITQLDQIFEIFDDLDTAIEAFKS